MAKSPKSPKLKPRPDRTARRTRIAAAKIAGRSTTAIAREEGLSRDWIHQELGSDECRQIILDLVGSNRVRIAGLFTQTLDSIEAAFSADKTAMYLGDEVKLGPDHYARLAAAKRFLELVSLGRPTAQPKDSGNQQKRITVEELKAIVAEREKTTGQVVN